MVRVTELRRGGGVDLLITLFLLMVENGLGRMWEGNGNGMRWERG